MPSSHHCASQAGAKRVRQVDDTTSHYNDDTTQRGGIVDELDGDVEPRKSLKTSKCAFCRKDHKKCVRTSDSDKCRSKAKECLPVDRIWPDICERCRDKQLLCSEPSRKKTRVDEGPSTRTDTLKTGTQQSMTSTVINYTTPPDAPQLFSSEWMTRQPLSTVGKSSLQGPPRIASEDSNLAMLSRTSPKLQSITPDYALTKYQRAMAQDRWKQALIKIREGIRLKNIPSVLLFVPQSDGIVLCNVCMRLGLSRESFIIDNKDHYNRLRRNLLYPQDHDWPVAKQAEMGRGFPLGEFKLGEFHAIRKKAQICSFCRLVWNSVRDQVPSPVFAKIGPKDDAIMGYATWQIDSRQLIPSGSGKTSSTKPRNRCIRLHWSKGASQIFLSSGIVLKDAFIVLVVDNKRSWANNFIGCPIDIGKSTTSICKDWVETCQNHHPHSNENISGDQLNWREAFGHNFKLLDLLQMCTVSPEQATLPPYVALSYTWADERNFHFRDVQAEKFEFLGERGEVEKLLPQLPRTIQDTISLAIALEFRYLWVDVLCAIYDASGRNHRAAAQIFSNAFLTVCAADDQSLNAGLAALHTPRKPVVQHIEKCAPGLELMVSHPAETYISQSPWNRRAWTFQERYLSKRCLIFAADQIYWECRDSIASESIVEHSREPSWTINMLYNPLYSMGNLYDQTQALRAYMRCVEEYSLRELTRPEDVLVAFESVGRKIGTSLQTELFCGLPSSCLDFALLWEFKMGTNQRRQSSGVSKFPTWSWCGWEGPVTYRSSTLSGILGNIPGWISKHTWISWYVRDSYNHTRLLHKSGLESITAATTQDMSELEKIISPLKLEGRQQHDISRAIQRRMQSCQPHVKWPAQNRSLFFKSVSSLQFDTVDVENESQEDPERRHTKYLQFWTWSGFFRLKYSPLSSSSNLGLGLSRFGVLDNKNDFCGTIVLPDRWASEEKPRDAVHEVIAISEAKNFTPEEFDGWTYYIPKEKDESEWDLWYVLLVEKIDDVVVRRIGLGKVFQEAFENSYQPGKEWREFIMA
ncbi:hypothetical protein BDZ45DRAFT_696321 [Acephala macrosclerotiorum]|nr:hypothetical protein BDZ45DRAFT_696321 [Acephala macrosclerotiorum]